MSGIAVDILTAIKESLNPRFGAEYIPDPEPVDNNQNEPNNGNVAPEQATEEDHLEQAPKEAPQKVEDEKHEEPAGPDQYATTRAQFDHTVFHCISPNELANMDDSDTLYLINGLNEETSNVILRFVQNRGHPHSVCVICGLNHYADKCTLIAAVEDRLKRFRLLDICLFCLRSNDVCGGRCQPQSCYCCQHASSFYRGGDGTQGRHHLALCPIPEMQDNDLWLLNELNAAHRRRFRQ